MVAKDKSDDSFFRSAMNKLKNLGNKEDSGKVGRGSVDIGCDIDSSGKKLLSCLAKGMSPFEDEMMICVDKKDFVKKEAAIRAAARDLGVKVSIKRNVKTSDISDAMCIVVSSSARKKIIKSG